MADHVTDAPERQEFQEHRERLRSMLAADLGKLDYPQAYARAVAWNRLLHEELGDALASPLNHHLATQPQHTLHQMRTVATGLNAQLNELGLAVRCPASGRPASLVAETKGLAEPGVFRYRFQESGDGGRPKRHAACRTLPELSLMPLPARVESFARRYRGPGRSGPEDQGPRR